MVNFQGMSSNKVIDYEATAQKPKIYRKKRKPLSYGRLIIGELHDPSLPEVKRCTGQKWMPRVFDTQVYYCVSLGHCVFPRVKDMKWL